MSSQRGDISFADALTAARRLGATAEADLQAIVRALDLQSGAPPSAAPVEPPPDEPPRIDTTSVAAEPEPSRQPSSADPTWDDVQLTTYPAGEPERTPPAWASGERIDFLAPRAATLPPTPPLPREVARAAMSAVIATHHVGRRLDLDWIVRRAARLEPIAPPRLLGELRTAPVIWLLVDCGEGMEPYAADTTFLVAELIAVGGTDRIDRHAFTGTPTRGLDPDPRTGKAKPWTPPPPRALLVVLSDLGAGGPPGSRDCASAAAWAAFAKSVSSADATLRALTPFGRARRPSAVEHAAAWESVTELMALRA